MKHPDFSIIPWGGWDHVARVANAHVELLCTLEVGPRVISFGPVGGRNLFKTYEGQIGRTGGASWRNYGGHRLWHAPESVPRTYAPDNGPVEHDWADGVLRLSPAAEPLTGIRKQLEVRLDPEQPRVLVRHRLINESLWKVELAPWALSVMAAGGTAFLPQEPYRPHPEALLPARPLVLWPYIDMQDQRLHWGSRAVEIKQQPGAASPLKIGARNTLAWAAYYLDGLLFLKRTRFNDLAVYPDFGCNYEFYTDGGMLEVESLGPMTQLAPGAMVEHDEEWWLESAELPEDRDARVEAVFKIAGASRS